MNDIEKIKQQLKLLTDTQSFFLEMLENLKDKVNELEKKRDIEKYIFKKS